MMSNDHALTENQINAIKRRVELATSGPWTSYVEGRNHMSGSDFIMTSGEDIYLSGATKFDQDFIACARQDIPILLNEIERLNSLLIQK